MSEWGSWSLGRERGREGLRADCLGMILHHYRAYSVPLYYFIGHYAPAAGHRVWEGNQDLVQGDVYINLQVP